LQKAYDLANARVVNDAKYKTVIKNYQNYQKNNKDLARKARSLTLA